MVAAELLHRCEVALRLDPPSAIAITPSACARLARLAVIAAR